MADKQFAIAAASMREAFGPCPAPSGPGSSISRPGTPGMPKSTRNW